MYQTNQQTNKQYSEVPRKNRTMKCFLKTHEGPLKMYEGCNGLRAKTKNATTQCNNSHRMEHTRVPRRPCYSCVERGIVRKEIEI